MTTLVIITGASKGIGRSTACAFAKDPRINMLDLCLVARNQEGLFQTQSLARNALPPDKNVDSSVHSIDLSNLDTLETKIKDTFQQKMKQNNNYERAILINNAASLGYVGPSSELPSPADLKGSVDFNITSSVWLSSYFVRYFGHRHKIKCNVVNMSSLCAVAPFKTMAMYCAGKASVRMAFFSLII
jgi:sepiapterin reductase